MRENIPKMIINKLTEMRNENSILDRLEILLEECHRDCHCFVRIRSNSRAKYVTRVSLNLKEV